MRAGQHELTNFMNVSFLGLRGNIAVLGFLCRFDESPSSFD